jgi:hypothetical protein
MDMKGRNMTKMGFLVRSLHKDMQFSGKMSSTG